ncbi:protein shisa-5 isoform X1 [Lepisosteus oculatus]|uniref:Protein shisa-5 n=1 Tax=Lepisosteus oculatus TaxID=7918 RepID=W5N8S9_LEPOC|nr:PREDICTED: protein shisa-5-like isoform X1 [Lepisosteus oculatus]
MRRDMAGTSLIIFITLAVFVPVALSDDCESYIDSLGKFHGEQKCSLFQFCCGSCENRYCCGRFSDKLDEDEQKTCFIRRRWDEMGKSGEIAYSAWESMTTSHTSGMGMSIAIGVTIFIIFIIIIISCCTCSCCCLYKMCRKPPRPIVTTTATTTVMQIPYPQQPAAPQTYPGPQYPGYQPVPVQPGYGNQPLPTAPYPGQQYAPTYPASGPPPPYQEAVPGPAPYPPQPAYSPAHPPASYDCGQPAYPPQQGYPAQPDYNSSQPAYNPAYMDQQKNAY